MWHLILGDLPDLPGHGAVHPALVVPAGARDGQGYLQWSPLTSTILLYLVLRHKKETHSNLRLAYVNGSYIKQPKNVCSKVHPIEVEKNRNAVDSSIRIRKKKKIKKISKKIKCFFQKETRRCEKEAGVHIIRVISADTGPACGCKHEVFDCFTDFLDTCALYYLQM